MNGPQPEILLRLITDGRTELVFDVIAAGRPATQQDSRSVSLIRHCAYYGDVSAIKFLLIHGESLASLGENFGLNAAAFHGHWRLCKFVLEQGADANRPLPDTGETPLHAALCKADTVVYDRVVKVLLAHGADPKCATIPGIETGSFMRDCRTKGETPLHRAAAFGGEDTIQLLLDAGAKIDAVDMNGDSPLSWASWHLRPAAILRKLCFGDHRLHPHYQDMRANLLGHPDLRR
jgi:uncharacterized protein